MIAVINNRYRLLENHFENSWNNIWTCLWWAVCQWHFWRTVTMFQ
jgi:succinate dehydrogenase hydrophobic anchor subunit